MRPFLELSTLALLLFLGWQVPFRDRLNGTGGTASGKPEAQQLAPAETLPPLTPSGGPPKDNSWMWQPSTLDAKPRSPSRR